MKDLTNRLGPIYGDSLPPAGAYSRGCGPLFPIRHFLGCAKQLTGQEMVELTQGEIIQIFRKRAGINQGQLGAEAFNTTVDSGRTKIKNIELNKQKPTIDDLKAIAGSLRLPLPDLLSCQSERPDSPTPTNSEGVFVHQRIFKYFKGLEECLSILNKALILDDKELISYVAKKAAGLLLQESKTEDSLQSI